MNRSTKISLHTIAICSTYLMCQAQMLADESSVSTTNSTPNETSSSSYKAETGPGAAKVSKTKASVRGNADGSVSANRSHESHTMTNAGSAHHKVNSSTTVNPDGSASSTNQESRSTSPQ